MPVKIYLNPEHGGSDSGGCFGGFTEKELNLKAAKYCRDYLNKYDCAVFLSREDSSSDLLIGKRIDDIKEKKVSVVITIAHNTGGGRGCEIFYPKGDDCSKKLAELIEESFKEIGQISRGIRACSEAAHNFAMVREPSKMGIASVLSEFAFLDNGKDRLLIDSGEDLKKEGEAIGKAVKNYLNLRTVSENSAPEAQSCPAIYKIQIGAFRLRQNAESYVKYVTRLGFEAFIKEDSSGDGIIFRIQAADAFREKKKADEYLRELREAGIEGFIYESE